MSSLKKKCLHVFKSCINFFVQLIITKEKSGGGIEMYYSKKKKKKKGRVSAAWLNGLKGSSSLAVD